MKRLSRGGFSLSAVRNWLPLVSVLMLSGCLTPTSYVDPKLPIVKAEDLKPAAPVGPVQLMVEFRTKGAPNSAATAKVKPIVSRTIEKSGIFSQLSDTPVPDGQTLAIVIDNVKVDDKDPATSGFLTGLTFGLAGTMVTDGYVCTATYRAAGGKTNATTVRHALHTTIGNASGPPGLAPVKPIEGVTQIVEQLTLNALQQLRKDGL